MSSTMRCPRCAAMLPASAQFCRRCGAAQGQVGERVAPPLIQSPIRPNWRARIGWFTILGFFGLVGGGLVLMNQEPSTPATRITPVVSPPVVYPQTVMPSYPASPQILRPAYPDRTTPPVYPEHDGSKYESHDRGHEHDHDRR